MDDAGLALVEGQSPGRQPRGQPRLDLLGLFTRVTQGELVVGVSDQHSAARHRCSDVAVVADSGGFFHPVQGHVHQHGADHPALRAAPLGWSEATLVEYSRRQPLLDPSPGGEGAELGEEVGVLNPVERGGQVGIQCPQALTGLPSRGHEDCLHRVLARAARPEPIRSGLEPGLPLGLQCGHRQGL